MNRRARDHSEQPAVTLCSGRPAPYVEGLLQAIDGHLPAVYENGAGLYNPVGYQFTPHPDTRFIGDLLQEVQQRLQDGLVASGKAYFQPGKMHSFSLFPRSPVATAQLRKLAAAALGPLSESVDLVYSTSCLNVLPRGIDKGKGVEYLAQTIGLPAEGMLGVGDSDVDLPFLARVGISAAPANANSAVRQLVDYLSLHSDGDGVRDILRHFGLLP
jgi:HAD superfamily hydrolase (TIGR01484 family)